MHHEPDGLVLELSYGGLHDDLVAGGAELVLHCLPHAVAYATRQQQREDMFGGLICY